MVIRPQAGGEFEVAGLGERDPFLRRLRGGLVSMVFQEPMASLSPVHTVGSQVAEPLRLHRGRNQAQALAGAARALAEVGIPQAEDRPHRYPHEFSGGMRQRAALAMALAAGPEVLLADEPTTALDVSVQAQVLNLLRSLQGEMGLSFLFVAHDLAVVKHFCDRVAVMYADRLVEIGPSPALYADPQHPYTQALLAAIPVPDPDAPEPPLLAGEPPDPGNLPPGCPFHPRCPKRFERCERERPELRPTPGGTLAACHLYPEPTTPPPAPAQ